MYQINNYQQRETYETKVCNPYDNKDKECSGYCGRC